MLEAFSKYTVADWQKAQDRAIYQRRNPFKKKASGYLRGAWKRRVFQATGLTTLQFENPLYGRMVDMGVGRGVGYSDQKYASSKWGRRMGDGVGRKPQRWVGKTKTYSQRRLGELLTKRYGAGLVDMAKEILTMQTTMSF